MERRVSLADKPEKTAVVTGGRARHRPAPRRWRSRASAATPSRWSTGSAARSRRPRLAEVASRCGVEPASPLARATSPTTPRPVQAAGRDSCTSAWGRVDVLVNNAGISQPKATARDQRGRVGPEPSRSTSRATSTGARRWRRADAGAAAAGASSTSPRSARTPAPATTAVSQLRLLRRRRPGSSA